MADKIRIQNVLAEVQKRIDEQRAQQLVELKTAITQVQFGKSNSQKIGKSTSPQSAANINASIANQNTPSKPKLVSSTPSSTSTTPASSSSGSSSTSSPAASSSSSTAGSKYTPGSVSDKIHNMSTAVADSKLATGAGKVLSKAAVPLTVIGAGLEYGDRRSKGQSVGKAAGGAAADTAGGLAGAYGGATAGAALGALGGPLAPITVPLGGIAGGIAGAVGGSHLAGKAYDWATGADKDKPEGTSTSPEAPKEQEKPKLAAPALNGPFKSEKSEEKESGPNKKKVNEALLEAFYRINR
jgi:hypothetical protein